MYSYELDNYIKERNYQLNAHQLEFIMDTREHPQITRIAYNDQSKSYDIYTSDNYHLFFNIIPYEDYCNQIRDMILSNDSEGYRLYVATKDHIYSLYAIEDDITNLFPILDQMILNNEYRHNRYLIIYNKDCPSFVYLGYGNKLDYLRFKKQILENVSKRGTKGLSFK